MKKKIAILGSTGSIGKSFLSVVKKDNKNIEIVLLSGNTNYKDLIKQAKSFKVKNLIITDQKSFQIAKQKLKKTKINLFNNFNNFHKIFKSKIDYVMSSIVGIDGLYPTLKIIKHTKKIAIANKESIICGWNILKKNLLKFKTEFIPVDSEHFSIWYAIKNNNDLIHKIYLTASGGPFLNIPKSKLKNIRISEATNHPNWKMGRKISVDSATMMNKVFEIIEAKKIFDIEYNKLDILTHPSSYLHAIIKYSNGMSKLVVHDTDMRIPIFNTFYDFTNKIKNFNDKINLNKLNKLNLKRIDKKQFPLVNLLDLMPTRNSLYETAIVSANDVLANQFLDKKIKFSDIEKNLIKLANSSEFIKFKKKTPKNINDIIKLNNYVRLKLSKKV
jgi:1-deoxy-D-xylulose-5-phosphate reductoisomerase